MLDGRFIIYFGGNGLMEHWIKLRKQRPVFYTRFINEDNLEQINNLSVQSKYWSYFFSIHFFAIGASIFPSIGGFNLENPFSIAFLIMESIPIFFMFIFTYKFLILNWDYNAFKKKYYSFLFAFGYWLLVIIFALIGYLTVKSYYNEENDLIWSPCIWPVIIFYIPLLFIYYAFCKCAFGKCFYKYFDEWLKFHYSKG